MQSSDHTWAVLKLCLGEFEVAREPFNAVYIGSEDFWTYDSDSFNDETNFYTNAWLIPASEVTEEAIAEGNLARCQMYFEVGKTDNHNFTPTSIVFDEGAGFLLVGGEQGIIGQPEKTNPKNKVFGVNKLAQRYKNLTQGPESNAPARFMVNYIIPDNSDDKEAIQSFIATLEPSEEKEEVEEDELGAWEDAKIDAKAEEEVLNVEEETRQDYMEEWNAENLSRINPVEVEGAEDIHGAEDLEEMTEIDANANLVGQDYDGLVVGQEAEEDADYTPEEYSPYEDPAEFTPMDSEQDYMEDWHNAEDIVEWVQELPIIEDFRLSGWTASIIVIGIAALTGSWLMKTEQ